MYRNFSEVCTLVDIMDINSCYVLVPIQKGVFRQVSLKSLIADSIVVCNDDPVATISITSEDTAKTINTVLEESSNAEMSIEDRALEYLEHTKRGRKPRMDYGKLEALKRAGWSVKDIALELKCTPGAIYNYLKKHPIN